MRRSSVQIRDGPQFGVVDRLADHSAGCGKGEGSIPFSSTNKMHIMNRQEQIIKRKQGMPNRHGRKLEKYSSGFNENFLFFFRLTRNGLIDFCGERIDVYPTSDRKFTAKYCFRLFEDGFYGKAKRIECYQPNVLRSVLMGKKGWGLWSKEYAMGIASGDFTKREVLSTFEDNGVTIPECFMNEFDNKIVKFALDVNRKIGP